MRLPLSKVYRAFPELDRFSDAECARYLALQHRLDSGTCPARTLRPALVLWAIAIVSGVGAWVALTRPSGGRWLTAHDATIIVTAGSAAIVCAVLGSMLWRDAHLRASLRNRLQRDRCEKCDRSILGATVRFGQLVCPGCGNTDDLHKRGLIAEDVFGRESAMDGLAVPCRRTCGHCGGPLLNAPIAAGEVVCPGCRARIPAGRLGLSQEDFEAGRLIELMNGRRLMFERKCAGCDYPLQGLTIQDSAVTCPECGLRAELAALLYDTGVVMWHAIELGILEAGDKSDDDGSPHPTSANPSDSP